MMLKQSAELTKEMVFIAHKSNCLDDLKDQEINRLIRTRYTASAEFAIHRHFLKGEQQEEFAVYNAFCEECKAIVNERIETILKEENSNEN